MSVTKSKLNVIGMFTEEELAEQAELEAIQFKKARKAGRKANKEARKMKLISYQFAFDPDSMPLVGQTVAIRHRTESDNKGKVSLVRADITVRTIKHVCMSDEEGNRIIDSMGEPWLVRPASVGHAKWETFKPGEKQKVLA